MSNKECMQHLNSTTQQVSLSDSTVAGPNNVIRKDKFRVEMKT